MTWGGGAVPVHVPGGRSCCFAALLAAGTRVVEAPANAIAVQGAPRAVAARANPFAAAATCSGVSCMLAAVRAQTALGPSSGVPADRL
jgi:hypothetical protein